jgi:membrane-bound metal-dependent hydrolase YbcI (DUF457 family)
MRLEHIIYSSAIAIIFGMVYYRYTRREFSWIIIASAYAPDLDIVANSMMKKLDITLLISGRPITHGDFHTLAALILYAFFVAVLLNLISIRFIDGFLFAGVGFGAHIFEDMLISPLGNGYSVLWPLSNQRIGLGLLKEKPDLYGIADPEVLAIGLALLTACILLRTAYEGTGWIKMLISVSDHFS